MFHNIDNYDPKFCMNMFEKYDKTPLLRPLKIKTILLLRVAFPVQNGFSLIIPYSILTLLLLNTTCPVLANSADPDQLVSEEAN